MGIFDGCLLASDIDGTLMESGYINPENIKKIEYFMSEGGYFSLSTGRTAGAVSDVLNKIKNISPSVVANGCMIYDFNNDEVLCAETVYKDDLKIIKYVLDNGLDIGIEAHSGKNVYTLNATRETDLHQEYESLPTVHKTFCDIENLGINKILLTFGSSEERENFKAKIKTEDFFKELTFNMINTAAMINGEPQNYCEFVPNGVSKASGIKKLCKLLKIKEGCCFGIGDYYNDLEMLKTANISAAPVTSPEEVKSLVDFITVPCNDGAVADFINFLESKFNAK